MFVDGTDIAVDDYLGILFRLRERKQNKLDKKELERLGYKDSTFRSLIGERRPR